MFDVNTLGPLYLYQATHPLLIAPRKINSKDAPTPKFFITSSALGSLGAFFATFPTTAYGTSKAAVNYVALGIHHQTEDVGAVVIPYHPGTFLPALPSFLSAVLISSFGDAGLVMTDMGPKDADAFSHIPNMPQAITPEQSAEEYVDLIDRSTRAEHGGKFWAQGSSEPYLW
jgi:norsolorinic acid ketoreductase